MKRLVSALTSLVLAVCLFSQTALAAVRPNSESLFTSSDPETAMVELEERLALTITDRTDDGISPDTLRALETAVNYLSANLVREAVQRISSRYGIPVEIVFSASSGQAYAGLTSLVVQPSGSYCTVELVTDASSVPDTGTILHELCHLVNFAMLDEQGANPLSSVFSALNSGIPYETEYISDGVLSWRDYVARLGLDPTRYFVQNYAMTNAYEDFACLFQAVALSSEWWEQRLLRDDYAPLRAKYTAAVNALERSFSSGSQSPLTDLFPADWAVEEWQRAKALGLIPDVLDRAYDSPITRVEFCQLMVQLLAVLWGEDPAALLSSQGIDVTRAPFPDTDAAEVAVLYALGAVDGRPDGTFDPDASITRQEAAKLLVQTAAAAGLTLSSAGGSLFSDEAQISAWAAPYVRAVSAAGMMTGTGNSQFSPRADYDRQQAFLTSLRLYDLLIAAQAKNSSQTNDISQP